MELERVKVSRFKDVKFWIKAFIVLVVLIFFYGLGNSSASVNLDKEKVTYDDLVKKVDSKNNEIKTVESKLADINQQYSDKQSEFNDATQVINNKKAAEDQLTTLTNQENDKKNQIADLDKQIKAKNDELASVTGQIKVKNEAPKTLPAGDFTVGKDIPAGRYKVESNGGSGNFFINGGAKANIMLGNGELFVSEYVFEVSDGDTIETNLPTKYIAVQ